VAFLKQLLEAAFMVRLQEAAVLLSAPIPDERRRGLVAAVEVDRPDQRFDGVGEKALAGAPAGRFLADAEQEVGAEAELFSPMRPSWARDEKGFLLRKAALGIVRVLGVELVGHDGRQHRISEELQALVVSPGPALAGERLVRHRQLEQARVLKTITDDGFERLGQGRAALTSWRGT